MAEPVPPPPVFTVISREVARRKPASIDDAGREVPAVGFATSFSRINMSQSKAVAIPIMDLAPITPPHLVHKVMRSRVTYLVLILVAAAAAWALVAS